MKSVLVLCLFLFGFTRLYSQDSVGQMTIADSSYNRVTYPAELTGNPMVPEEMQKYIAHNISYPQQAMDSNIEGTVLVSFVIEKDGSVDSVAVLRGIPGGSILDMEAVRVITSMPRWIPANSADKQPIRMKYIMPIRFSF